MKLLSDDEVEVFKDEHGVESAVYMGKTLPIVKAEKRNERTMTTAQAEVRLEIYKRLASMLPLEGRDYVFSVSFEGNSTSPSITFKPKNDLGSMWCKYIASEFAKMRK